MDNEQQKIIELNGIENMHEANPEHTYFLVPNPFFIIPTPHMQMPGG